MEDLDELIAAGWGNVPQVLIPPDWREISAGEWGAQRRAFTDLSPKAEEELVERLKADERRVRAAGLGATLQRLGWDEYAILELVDDEIKGRTNLPKGHRKPDLDGIEGNVV